MEEERTHREIELRSEEVQEVMGRIPPAILRYGIVVLLGIMAVVLAGSACFSYPDTVETEFTLTTQNPPAYIMAQSAGRIEQLYTANSQPVGKGDMLGVIENVARTEDLFVLRERMKEWKPHRAGGYALFPPDSGAGKCAGGVFVLPAGLEQLPSAHAGKQDV